METELKNMVDDVIKSDPLFEGFVYVHSAKIIEENPRIIGKDLLKIFLDEWNLVKTQDHKKKMNMYKKFIDMKYGKFESRRVDLERWMNQIENKTKELEKEEDMSFGKFLTKYAEKVNEVNKDFYGEPIITRDNKGVKEIYNNGEWIVK